jgi:hypothetical protein
LFRYDLTQTSQYEKDELSQVLLSVNGTLYGSPPEDFIDQVVGDGNGGDQVSTGWQSVEIDVGILPAGSHLVTIGGYNSRKDHSNESTDVLIDDVRVTGSVVGVFDPGADGADLDADGLCDAGDPDIDGDAVPNELDSDPFDRFVCRDVDEDNCDDCTSGVDDPANDGPDPDGDGICDADGCNDVDGDGLCSDVDPDDDNDTVVDELDAAPFDNKVCRDLDADTCDDCTSGIDDPANDGDDFDLDGACDAGDDDDDNDTVPDFQDCASLSPGISTLPGAVGATLVLEGKNATQLTWTRPPQGAVFNVYRGTLRGAADWVYDEACLDAETPEAVSTDEAIPTPGNGYYYLVNAENVCGESSLGADSTGADHVVADPCPDLNQDSDADGVPDLEDNCPTDINPALFDHDADFLGDICDPDDDNDGIGDDLDSAPRNPDLCGDSDGDTCDDCSVGTDNFGPLSDADPLNDGPDADGDGICDAGEAG